MAGIPNPASTATPGKDVVGFVIGAAGAANVTVAIPTAEASATAAAVTVTVPAAVARAADVYVTAAPEALVVGEIDPHAAPVQFVPDTDHVTPRFRASFATFAVNVCVTAPVARFAVPGVTDTLGGVGGAGAAANVMVAFADFVASSTAVAVSVTVGGFGTAAGAVYITAAPDAAVVPESEPQAAPVQPAPDSVHVVPSFFGSFATVAVKLAAWLVWTVAIGGVSATETIFATGAGLVDDPPPHPTIPAIDIITHALNAATFVRSTPRRKRIYPPGTRPGTGAAF